jgi:hypothetical protein
MTSTGFWKSALLGSQQVLALPVSDYMIVEQLEGHGLVDIRVVIQRPGDDSELGTGRKPRARKLTLEKLA